MIKTLFTPKDGGKWPLPSTAAIGGKGYGLYWLVVHKFPAPLTWVLSTSAFDLAIKRAGVADSIVALEEAWADLPDDWAVLQRRMDDLETERAQVVEALEQLEPIAHVTRLLAELPEERYWAVRSSATVEDNPRYSFAGQFLSLLLVPRADLWQAVCRVWASNYGRQVLSYCAQNRAPLPRMAVILQPMKPITAQDRAGVAFSHSPVPTLPGVLIQAVFGSGQVVVSGYGGDLFGVQGKKVQVQPLPPDHIRVTDEAGNMVPQPSPPGLALSEEEACELADLVLAVAGRWGRPVNVEFVWPAGKPPMLVQVRSVAGSL